MSQSGSDRTSNRRREPYKNGIKKPNLNKSSDSALLAPPGKDVTHLCEPIKKTKPEGLVSFGSTLNSYSEQIGYFGTLFWIKMWL